MQGKATQIIEPPSLEMSGINLVKHHSGIRVYIMVPRNTAKLFLQGPFLSGKKVAERFHMSVVPMETHCTSSVQCFGGFLLAEEMVGRGVQ